MTYPVHPAAELFPKMDAEALQALADDIREHGQREPVILYHGAVLDGRNRLRACELAGVERFGECPVEYAEEDSAAEREDEGVLCGEAQRERLAQAGQKVER